MDSQRILVFIIVSLIVLFTCMRCESRPELQLKLISQSQIGFRQVALNEASIWTLMRNIRPSHAHQSLRCLWAFLPRDYRVCMWAGVESAVHLSGVNIWRWVKTNGDNDISRICWERVCLWSKPTGQQMLPRTNPAFTRWKITHVVSESFIKKIDIERHSKRWVEQLFTSFHQTIMFVPKINILKEWWGEKACRAVSWLVLIISTMNESLALVITPWSYEFESHQEINMR